MKISKMFLVAVASVIGSGLYAQEQITIHKGCNFDGEETETEYYSFDPSDEAGRIVHNILQAMGGLSDKSFVIKESNVKNAVATVENGQRFILYSTVFLEKFKGDAKTKWAAYTVLAHEIGHHLNNHNFAEKDPKKRKSMELEADKFAGAVCRTLGATLDETLAGMESMNLPGETATHPIKSARTAAIANGWKRQDELLKNSNATAGQTPDERPEKPAEAGNEIKNIKKPDTDPSVALKNTQVPKPTDGGRCANCPDLVFVKGGSFTMGCQKGRDNHDECPYRDAYKVTLHDYYIGKYEITNAQYCEFLSTKGELYPWLTYSNDEIEQKNGKITPKAGTEQHPVVDVPWKAAKAYCEWLTQQSGKTYRLPSEAEWEYAARGGSASKGYMFSGSFTLEEVGWFQENAGYNRKVQPIGTLKANELGIYDMSGNVNEWCADDWHHDYDGAPTDGSAWVDTPRTSDRVFRGGSWNTTEYGCRIFCRDSRSNGHYEGGFRVVREK